MRFFYGSFVTGRAAAALLLLRLTFGIGIAAHGYQKFSSHGLENWTTGWLSWFGPGIPAPWQGVATVAEFFGGLGLALGLLTPLAAFAVFAAMTVAMCKVHFPAHEPYVSLTNGASYETCAHYLVAALAVLLAGPGVCSLDFLLFGRRYRRNPYAP